MTTAADMERVGTAGDCVTCEEYSDRVVCRGCYEKALKQLNATREALTAAAERQRGVCARYIQLNTLFEAQDPIALCLAAPLVKP